MFIEFDVNENFNRIAVLKHLQDGTKELITYDLKKRSLLGIINNDYQPLGPRFSSDGKLAFFSNRREMFLGTIKHGSASSFFDHSGLNAGFCEWSPNGEELCFSAHSTQLKTPPNIYTIHIKNKQVNQITDNDTVERFPQWSPCGKYIAFHRQYLHEPNTPKRIYIVNTSTKKCDAITVSEGVNHAISRYCWSNDSSHLLVKTGNTLNIIRTLDMEIVWTFFHAELEGGAFLTSNDNVLVICQKEVILVSFSERRFLQKSRLPEGISIKRTHKGPSISIGTVSNSIYFINEKSALYRMDEEGKCELLLNTQEEGMPAFTHREYTVKSKDGRIIPVHSFLPDNPTYKGILLVHGGPGEKVDDPRDPIVLRLLQEGYEVVVPSYRGCSGNGQEHKDANLGEYGRADVWDVLAVGEDWKEKQPNKRPLAILGYSYGGYLTFLSLSKERNPFDLGISLWGVTRLEHLKMHLPRAYPNDPDERDKAVVYRNPLIQANKIKSPLLIVHGTQDNTSTNDDVKCIQQRIQEHGGFCRVVMYEDGHGLGRHIQHVFEEVIAFLNNENGY